MFTSGNNWIGALVDSYQKLEESTEKANKRLFEALEHCEAFRNKYEKRGEKLEGLEKEKIALEKKIQEQEAKLDETGKGIVDRFK